MPVIDKKDRILQDVLDRITPTPKEQERTRQLVSSVVSATEEAIKGSGKGLDYVIAGSFTRDTWMKDKKEFDIFIRFPANVSRKLLEEQGLGLGRQVARTLHGRHTIAYAEHPYVRVKVKDYEVDVVPCYRVPSAMRIKSSVDRTPFHNEWLSKHFLSEMVPEVRLLKQFCKGQGIYGSDARTGGFSGYLCELLSMKFRSFKDLALRASSWKAGKVVINLEGMYPISDIKNIHKKFPKQPLIVVDPVDPGRNVAAALTPENFVRFVRACREFSSSPSIEYFFPKPPKPNISQVDSDLSDRKTRIIGFSCPAPKVIEDVLWPQLRRTGRRLRDILEEHDFGVHGHDVWTDGKTCVFFFEMEVPELPYIRKLRGPSVFDDVHSENFLKKYRPLGRLWVEDEYWHAEIRRQFTDSLSLLRKSISGSEHELKSNGIGSYLAKEIAKSRRPMKKREILALARKNREFGSLLEDYLEKNMS